MENETQGHGVVNLEEYKAAISKLETLAAEHRVSEFFADVIEALANMPKVVTNEPEPLA